MKKLLYLLLLCFPVTLFAQSVNDVPIKDINVEYMQIVGTTKLMSTKLTIEIDFGQFNSAWTNKDTQLRGADNKLVVFNSMIDALNFMTSNGYDFVQAYTVSVGSQHVYHYLLKRRH